MFLLYPLFLSISNQAITWLLCPVHCWKLAPYHDHVFRGTDMVTMRRHNCQGLRVPKCPFWWQHSHKLMELIKIWSPFPLGVHICTKPVYAEISTRVTFGSYMVKCFTHALTIQVLLSTFTVHWETWTCGLVLAAIITWSVFLFKIQSLIWLVSAEGWFTLARCLSDNLSNVSPACGKIKTKQFIHLTWKITLTVYKK